MDAGAEVGVETNFCLPVNVELGSSPDGMESAAMADPIQRYNHVTK